MTILNKIGLVSIFGAGLLAFGPAIAQEDESDGTYVVEEILVTASRRVQSVQDVPAAVVVVDPIEFIDSGLTSIGDVLEYTPGFHIDRGNGIRGGGSITARGVSQLGGTPVVAIYLDDVPLTSNNGFAAGGRILLDGLLGDLERIELIKGPQGTLFGATAVGGAVRYISREPALEEIRGGASVSLSDTNDGDLNQIYSGFVSLPIVADKLGVTLSGFYDDNGGFVDRVDPATGAVTKENADASEGYGFSGDILFRASDKLDFRAKALYQQVDYFGISSVRIADLDKTPTYGKRQGDDQFSTQSLEHTVVSGSLNYEFDWANLNLTSSMVEYKVGAEVDLTAAFAGLADLLQGNPPGTTTDVPFTSPLSSDKTIHELRLTSPESDNFEWILGLYYADESSEQDQLAITQPGDFLLFEASFPSQYNETAVFGNFTYYITPDFDLTAGIRYAETETELILITDGVLAGGPSNTPLPIAKADIQTYLFAARYRPNDNLSLYARVASGYRPATANFPIFDPFTGERLSQIVVDQDDLWSYEIGAKGHSANGFFGYDLSLWYLDWSEFQSFVVFFGVGGFGNAADGITAKGFEGAITLNPDNGFSLTSTLAYADSTLNADEPILNGLKGQSVPGVPEWTASTRARYDFDVSSDIPVYVGAGFRYVKGSPSAFTDGDVGDSAINIPSDTYTLVDLNAGVQLGNVGINLFVTNLLDEDTFVNILASVIPGTTMLDGRASPVRPRTIGVALSWDF